MVGDCGPGAAGPFAALAFPQLAHRIARVFRHRRKRARREGFACFRVYEREIADQPLVLDWYDGEAVLWAYDRTRNEGPGAEERWLAEACAAACAGLGIAREALHLKRRRRQEGRQEGGQYARLGSAGVERRVEEHGLVFLVNLRDYLDTGLFLDHRPLRARVRAEAAGRDALNLFAYTGGFTVAARAGGARRCVTVDLSATYLAWAARNLAANRLAEDPAHPLVRADCLRWLEAAAPAGPCHDLIVCDPPTFSNSSAMRGDFSVDRDHPALLARCAALLRPGGTLYFSTNSRGLRFAGPPPGLEAEDITAATIPEDFRDRRIHRCWRLVKPAGTRG